MVIRRIREHVAAQNWFAVGIDFLIVVAGIVIGTQVNNWNEARIERDSGREYQTRLIDDLQSNEADMRARYLYYSDVRRHAVKALDALGRPSGDFGESFLIDAFQATQIWPKSSKRFTYDEILAVGGVDGLGNAKLREKIDNYYTGIAVAGVITSSIPPYRERLRRLMPYVAQQRIESRCSNKFSVDQRNDLFASLAKTCELGLDAETVADGVTQIRGAPEIRFDLTRYLVDLDAKLASFKIVEWRARELRELIEQAEK